MKSCVRAEKGKCCPRIKSHVMPFYLDFFPYCTPMFSQEWGRVISAKICTTLSFFVCLMYLYSFGSYELWGGFSLVYNSAQGTEVTKVSHERVQLCRKFSFSAIQEIHLECSTQDNMLLGSKKKSMIVTLTTISHSSFLHLIIHNELETAD